MPSVLLNKCFHPESRMDVHNCTMFCFFVLLTNQISKNELKPKDKYSYNQRCSSCLKLAQGAHAAWFFFSFTLACTQILGLWSRQTAPESPARRPRVSKVAVSALLPKVAQSSRHEKWPYLAAGARKRLRGEI